MNIIYFYILFFCKTRLEEKATLTQRTFVSFVGRAFPRKTPTGTKRIKQTLVLCSPLSDANTPHIQNHFEH